MPNTNIIRDIQGKVCDVITWKLQFYLVQIEKCRCRSKMNGAKLESEQNVCTGNQVGINIGSHMLGIETDLHAGREGSEMYAT